MEQLFQTSGRKEACFYAGLCFNACLSSSGCIFSGPSSTRQYAIDASELLLATYITICIPASSSKLCLSGCSDIRIYRIPEQAMLTSGKIIAPMLKYISLSQPAWWFGNLANQQKRGGFQIYSQTGSAESWQVYISGHSVDYNRNTERKTMESYGKRMKGMHKLLQAAISSWPLACREQLDPHIYIYMFEQVSLNM